MDAVNDQLINELARNAHLSSRALAKKLNVSPSTVRRRCGRLLQAGTVRIVAVVDPPKVGIHIVAVIALQVSNENLQSLVKTLCDQPEVSWLAVTSGRFNILALAAFSSTDALSRFLQTRLPKAQGLNGAETLICLQVKKGKFMHLEPPLSKEQPSVTRNRVPHLRAV